MALAAGCGHPAAPVPPAPRTVAAVLAPAVIVGNGHLVSATRFVARLGPRAAFSASAWRVVYDSTDATGRRIVVSGTVLVPITPQHGPRPIVSYAVGTQGLADRCAPSAQLAVGTEDEAPLLTAPLARGWAVAITDYPGLGEPGEHPFGVGRALGPAVLDVLRAARQIPGTGLDPSGPAGVLGYSEGGGAAGWAAQLQPTYAPDVPLVGVAVGGVTADLSVIARHLDGGPESFLVPYAAVGIAVAYPAFDLSAHLTARGREVVTGLEQTCFDDAPAAYPPGERLASITTTDVLASPQVQSLLAQNRLGAIRPAAPILLQHSRSDDFLPFAQAAALATEWCDDGTTLEFRPLESGGHIATSVVAIPAAVTWLAGRFAGTPAQGCQRRVTTGG